MMWLFITYQIGKIQKFWLHCIQDFYEGNLVLPMKIINAHNFWFNSISEFTLQIFIILGKIYVHDPSMQDHL